MLYINLYFDNILRKEYIGILPHGLFDLFEEDFRFRVIKKIIAAYHSLFLCSFKQKLCEVLMVRNAVEK